MAKPLEYQIPLPFSTSKPVDQSTLKTYDTSNGRPIPLSRLPVMKWNKDGHVYNYNQQTGLMIPWVKVKYNG